MKEKICSFCGHSDIPVAAVSRYAIKEIASLIKKGVTTFYSNSTGEFNTHCEDIVRVFKKKNKNIKLCRVDSYIMDDMDLYDYYNSRYDKIIVPELNYIYPQKSGTERDRWMVEQSDVILACVYRKTGGAAAMLEYAKIAGVECVNIYGKN